MTPTPGEGEIPASPGSQPPHTGGQGAALGRAGRRAGQHLEDLFGGPERTRVIVVLACVLALSSADIATVGAAASPLRKALHVSNTDIGLLVTASSLVAAVASLPFGILADRLRRTRTLGFTVGLWGVAMLWSATAGSFDKLLLSRLFLGAVNASAGPIVASMVGDYFPSAERGRIYGYILTGELLGAGLGFAVTGDVASLSWRAAFVILALPTFVLARYILRLPEPARGGVAPLPRWDGPDGPGAPRDRTGPAPASPDVPAVYDPGRFDPANYVGTEYVGPPPPGRREVGFDAGSYESWASLQPTPPTGGEGDRGDGDGGGGDGGRAAGGAAGGDTGPQETDAQKVARERGITADPDRVLRVNARQMGIWSATKYLLHIRTNVVLIVASACLYFYMAGVETFGAEFTSDQYRVPSAVANLLILLVGVGAVVGVLVGGTLSDGLLKRKILNARVLLAAIGAVATAAFFLPALLTRSTVTAVPYLALAAFALTVQEAPIDAARLDIVPPLLWGRAEGLRTLLRTGAQSLAPVLFGALSSLLGGGRSGLQLTFLIMLVPLIANGVILFSARRTYPRDVATAAAAAPSGTGLAGGKLRVVKIRIGIGATSSDPGLLGALCDGIVAEGFDSLWLSEVLTTGGVDPLVGMAWAAGRYPGLKVGTTMLLPGRHPLRAAKALASLDRLTNGQLLVTVVPGLPAGRERHAVGGGPAGRGADIDELLPLLRRLWSGEEVTWSGGGVSLEAVRLSPLPAQVPLEVWLGGMAPTALDRCGRLGDGWLPARCTPAEAAAGREVVEAAAAAAGRAISDEHFGVSLAYALDPLSPAESAAITARGRGVDPTAVVPVGRPAVRELLQRFVTVGFSKFVLRPLRPPADWQEELAELASAVGDLQT